MSTTPPLSAPGWPTNRVLTTAQRVALTQDQINLMPVGFQVYEIEANILVAIWVRDTLAVGGLRQYQPPPTPPPPASVTVASLGDGLTYVEEYDVPRGEVNARTVILGNAQRNARLVSALMIYNGAAGPADLAGSFVDVENANGVALASFEIDENTPTGTIVPPTTYDVTIGVATAQVTAGQPVTLDITQGDVGFRLILTWKAVV